DVTGAPHPYIVHVGIRVLSHALGLHIRTFEEDRTTCALSITLRVICHVVVTLEVIIAKDANLTRGQFQPTFLSDDEFADPFRVLLRVARNESDRSIAAVEYAAVDRKRTIDHYETTIGANRTGRGEVLANEQSLTAHVAADCVGCGSIQRAYTTF